MVLGVKFFLMLELQIGGLGSDKSIDILRRIDTILSVHPQKAFIMVGINDIANGSKDELFGNYVKIIEELRTNGIEVFVQSTIECSISVCGDMNALIRIHNRLLEDYCIDHGFVFVNINEQLSTKSDGLLPQYTYDGVHLLGKGYYVWAEQIKGILQE